jgi:hypothetical protein
LSRHQSGVGAGGEGGGDRVWVMGSEVG